MAEWFPRRERALAAGLSNSGANVGAICAPLLVPWIALNCGWQMVFIVLGATGFGWIFFWYWLYASPVASPHVSPAEPAHINSDPPEPASKKIPWRELLRHRQTGAFVLGMFGSIAAMAFSQSAGFILQATGSYWSLCIIAPSAYVLALALMHALIPDLKPAEVNRE